ncbi:MAG TPA: 2OG-Fe(II) oxygenase [Steroidobacteraceae bacterium]|jgi:TPR repeat protein|nr:2OG-Fe(II) oxygenase [Steroidobacteraceae bacterium]
MSDTAALTALGKRLLIGEGVPMSVDKAIATLRDAVAQGGGEAAALLAVCAAWGVGQARNVETALDHLVRAAQLGWTSALHELQLLARDPRTDAAALRGKIDVAALRSAPSARVVFERPRIAVFERFATEDECQWLIGRAGGGLQRAKVYRGSATAQVAETRTNREMSLTIFNADVALSLIRDRIAAACGAAVTHFEIAKILHYSPGEQFALHADFIEAKTPELARELAARGQRAATFLIYLNAGYEGGATQFPRLDWQYRGGRGDALLFSNVNTDGGPDYDTVHAGMPPTSGEKWVLSQWIRTRPLGP